MKGLSSLGWGLVASIAVLWPSRLAGPLDGAPLDTLAEAVLAGVLLPFAWILHPSVFRARAPRAIAAALAAWKLGTWLLLTQQGLCATFAVSSAAGDHLTLRRSWDFRTPAPHALPQCSAVVTRDLDRRAAFPAWFLNLPAGADRNLDDGSHRNVELPASPRVVMNVTGYIASAAGVREIDVESELTGDVWQFDMPRASWRDTATITPPSRLDLWARHLWVVSPLLTLALVGGWIGRALARLRLPRHSIAALAALVAAGAALGVAGAPYARGTALLIGCVLLLRMPMRLQGPRAVIVFVGMPLLAMLVAASRSQAGQFTMYTAGDDWQTFQRFAARIYFDGFWLEGGEPTFWQQPLYRWIAGLLHVVFGDSSVGEMYWDGFGLLASAVLAYVLVRPYASHRWALAAAVATLATTLLGPTWHLIGRGLSEISGALWLALTALALLRARRGHIGAAALAGVLGTLAFYTRLNNLIVILALVVLLLPSAPAGSWTAARRVFDMLRARAALIYGSMVIAGVTLFAARTWYYTGHFSLFHGTSRQFHTTGLAFDTLADPMVWGRVLESVLMVVTVNDPPRLDPRSALVVLGTAAAVCRVFRAPLLRDIPLAPAVLCVAAIAGAFIVRGITYPGRFSLHLIPLAVAVSILLASRIASRVRPFGAIAGAAQARPS